jgi:hypothetical protein
MQALAFPLKADRTYAWNAQKESMESLNSGMKNTWNTVPAAAATTNLNSNNLERSKSM